MDPSRSFTVHDLERIVREHDNSENVDSNTSKRLAKGIEHCGKKLAEEALEAAMAKDDQNFIAEGADLLTYFVLLLKIRKLKLADIEQELFRRTQSPNNPKKAIP